MATAKDEVLAAKSQIDIDKTAIDKAVSDAQTSATKAKESETKAKESETASAQSASEALTSKNEASTSATVATEKATLASTKADEAFTSATNAEASEIKSKESETNVAAMQTQVTKDKEAVTEIKIDITALQESIIASGDKINTDADTAIQNIEAKKTEVVDAIEQYGAVQVSEEVPTNPHVDVHIIPSTEEDYSIPEVRDDLVNEVDTWSSKKINGELRGKADAIVETASGEIITVEDSSDKLFEGLKVFGKSTQDGVPSPENPVPIVSVGDKGTVEIEVTGKNLLKPLLEPEVQGTYVGWKIKDNDETITISIIDKAPDVTISNALTVGLTGSGIDASKGVEWLVLNGETKKTSVSSQLKYFSIYPNNAISTVVEKYDIQIEYGTSATAHEPYTHQSLILQTPNGLPGIKVNSNGNYTDENGQQWICDEIDLERGKYVQRIKNTIFDGSEDEKWGKYIDSNSTYGFQINIPDMMVGAITKKGFVDKFNTINTGISSSDSDCIMFGTNTNTIMYLKINRSHLQNNGVSVFRNWLQTNTLNVMYLLASPIEHDLTPEEIAAYKALHTNYPTTVISNDEAAHMEVSYVADTKNYIAKVNAPLQKQITELQNALISQKISGGYKGI